MTKQEIARSLDNILWAGNHSDLVRTALKELRAKVETDAKAEREKPEDVFDGNFRQGTTVSPLFATCLGEVRIANDPAQTHVRYA